MNNFRRVGDCIWKLAVSGAAYAVAGMIMAAGVTAGGMHPPTMPRGASAGHSEALSLALSLLLAAGVAPLAAGLRAGYSVRWLALSFLIFVNLGANTVIEAEIFMTTFAKGGAAFLIVMDAGAALAFGAVLARFFGPGPAMTTAACLRRGAVDWAWRVALAVLAFPVIYYALGLTVAPFVVPAYRAGVAGLVLPKVSVVVPVEIGRSALYLLSSLPVIWLWTRSRRGLILALGWADAVTTGLFGLLQAYWFPPVLRIAHSLEITADSFVYALVLVALLTPRVNSAERAARNSGPSVPAAA